MCYMIDGGSHSIQHESNQLHILTDRQLDRANSNVCKSRRVEEEAN